VQKIQKEKGRSVFIGCFPGRPERIHNALIFKHNICWEKINTAHKIKGTLIHPQGRHERVSQRPVVQNCVWQAAGRTDGAREGVWARSLCRQKDALHNDRAEPERHPQVLRRGAQGLHDCESSTEREDRKGDATPVAKRVGGWLGGWAPCLLGFYCLIGWAQVCWVVIA